MLLQQEAPQLTPMTEPANTADTETDLSPVVVRFCRFYEELSSENLTQLPEVYSENIHFMDPAHEFHGLAQLTEYFIELMKNQKGCEFIIRDVADIGNEAYLQWTMAFRHPLLNFGRTVSVDGASHIRFDDKVTFHRDYFDLGAMIYENLPLLGRMVRAMKQRLGQ